MAFTPRFPSATQLGIHGDWSEKKPRLSISIVPLKVSPSANAARQAATIGVSFGPNFPCW